MLATKLRALLQRNKGRDLYDLAHGLEVFEALTEESTAESFRRVFVVLNDRLPGEPWGRTETMKRRFGITW